MKSEEVTLDDEDAEGQNDEDIEYLKKRIQHLYIRKTLPRRNSQSYKGSTSRPIKENKTFVTTVTNLDTLKVIVQNIRRRNPETVIPKEKRRKISRKHETTLKKKRKKKKK